MTRKTDMKPPKILFFHVGHMPTAADFEECLDYGANIQYRNVNFVYPDEQLEQCDGVAGKVPEAYANCPTAEEAIETFRARIKAAMGGTDEEKAPRTKGAKPTKEKSEGDGTGTGTAPEWKG